MMEQDDILGNCVGVDAQVELFILLMVKERLDQKLLEDAFNTINLLVYYKYKGIVLSLHTSLKAVDTIGNYSKQWLA